MSEDIHIDVLPAPLRPLYVVAYWQVVNGLHLYEWITRRGTVRWTVLSQN